MCVIQSDQIVLTVYLQYTVVHKEQCRKHWCMWLCLWMHKASVKTETLHFFSGQRLTSHPLGPARARIPPRVCVWVSHAGIASDKGGTLANCIPIPPKATHLFPFLCLVGPLGWRRPRHWSGTLRRLESEERKCFHAFFHLMPFPKKYCRLLTQKVRSAKSWALILERLVVGTWSPPPQSPFKNQQIHLLNSCTSVLNR